LISQQNEKNRQLIKTKSILELQIKEIGSVDLSRSGKQIYKKGGANKYNHFGVFKEDQEYQSIEHEK